MTRYWFRVADDPAFLAGLSRVELLTYMMICRAVGRGEAGIARAELARQCGISPTTQWRISKAIERLKESGAIFEAGERQRGKVFSISIIPNGTTREKHSYSKRNNSVIPSGTTRGTHKGIRKLEAEKQAGAARPVAPKPEAEAYLRAEGAGESLISRILGMPEIRGISDAQAIWVLRAARRDHQRGPGLYLRTVPEVIARQIAATTKSSPKPTLEVEEDHKCMICNDIGTIQASDPVRFHGERMEAFMRRIRESRIACVCQGTIPGAELARIGPTSEAWASGSSTRKEARRGSSNG